MKISTKGRYGVKIMLDIAQNGTDFPVKISDISARQNISTKYTEQITGNLARSGLVRSVRGAQGGYVLAKKASAYTVGEILRKTEGDLAPVVGIKDGEGEGGYAVNKLWTGLYDSINNYLDGVTLQDLVDWEGNASDFYSI